MIVGLGHVAYRIGDLDAALSFYCDQLGLTEAFRMNHDDGTPWIVYIRVNDNHFIELFPGATEGPEIPNGAIGYAHLCLRVDDIEGTLAQLESRGVTPTSGIRKGRSGCLQCWIADPDGNRIELMEILPDSLQAMSVSD